MRATLTSTCRFETKRLVVGEWHSILAAESRIEDLAPVVCALLTDRVTAPLPSAWHGPYTLERARCWIEARDREGPTFLVVARTDARPVGLMFLFESGTDDTSGVQVRLGYLLAESAWGDGLATELVEGIVGWCGRNRVATIVAGVRRDNLASQRVLEKNGFVRARADSVSGEEQFVLRVTARGSGMRAREREQL